MFVINQDGSIFLTRGDTAVIEISAKTADGSDHTFLVGDIVRLKITNRKRCDQVVLVKDVNVEEVSTSVSLTLDKGDTRFGEIIHKPVDYWYEVELNPDIAHQTMIGYDVDGPKIFRLFPEGGEVT